MNGTILRDLRMGRIDFQTAMLRGHGYIERMALFYWKRASWAPSLPIDLTDLRQIIAIAIWKAVREYEWRCPACHMAWNSEVEFEAHRITHPAVTEPSPTLERWVHGQVGNALDHEVRRYTRRGKFYEKAREYVSKPDHVLAFSSVLPENPVEPREEARQETICELRALVEHARLTLDPKRQKVFEAMMHDEMEVPGLTERQARRIRTELRKAFREYAAA